MQSEITDQVNIEQCSGLEEHEHKFDKNLAKHNKMTKNIGEGWAQNQIKVKKKSFEGTRIDAKITVNETKKSQTNNPSNKKKKKNKIWLFQ